MAHDVRAIANFVLDIADEEGRGITNLSINKIVFFLHSHYLVEFDKPLVSAKVAAWNYGPVFRELYREFKEFGDKAIERRALKLDALTGTRVICGYELSESERKILEDLTRRYIRFSAGNLVSMSHAKDGPCDQVRNHTTLSNPTMR